MCVFVCVPVFSIQSTSSLVAVLQGQAGALQLLPESRRLPLSLPPLLASVVQLRLAAFLLLLEPRSLQQRLVPRSDQGLGLQGGLAELGPQLFLPPAGRLQTAPLTLQLCFQSLDGETELVALGEEESIFLTFYHYQSFIRFTRLIQLCTKDINDACQTDQHISCIKKHLLKL